MKTLVAVALAYSFAFLAVFGLTGTTWDLGLDAFTGFYATTLLAFLMLPLAELALV